MDRLTLLWVFREPRFQWVNCARRVSPGSVLAGRWRGPRSVLCDVPQKKCCNRAASILPVDRSLIPNCANYFQTDKQGPEQMQIIDSIEKLEAIYSTPVGERSLWK